MKQPKRLTRDQKEFLSKRKINPDDYMLVTESKGQYILKHKTTGDEMIVEKKK